MSKKYPFYIVDAFTLKGKGFTGNQAAIVVLDSDVEIPDEIKQKMAAEINLSETAFVSKSWTGNAGDADNWTLRWFTPTNEVDLCGHATLATARIIFDRCPNLHQVTFDTKSKGRLIATLDATSGQISLDFPAAPPVPITSEQFPPLEELLRACLGKFRNTIKSVHYSADTKKLLVQLIGIVGHENNSVIPKLDPNFSEMLAVKGNDNRVRGIIVTIASDSKEAAFYSRYFAPWNGINEDPVTGSAHTVLMPFWHKYHDTLAGSLTLVGKQCSKRRGLLKCTMNGDRVTLSGSTEVIVEGSINVGI